MDSRRLVKHCYLSSTVSARCQIEIQNQKARSRSHACSRDRIGYCILMRAGTRGTRQRAFSPHLEANTRLTTRHAARTCALRVSLRSFPPPSTVSWFAAQSRAVFGFRVLLCSASGLAGSRMPRSLIRCVQAACLALQQLIHAHSRHSGVRAARGKQFRASSYACIHRPPSADHGCTPLALAFALATEPHVYSLPIAWRTVLALQ